MCHPDSQFHAGHIVQHHRLIFENIHIQERRFKFARFVVQHFGLKAVFGINQVQLHHQLAAVTNTETQCIGSTVEFFKCNACFFIVSKRTCPAFGRTQHIGIGKTTNKNNHVQIFQCFTPRNQVGHVHILYIHSGQVHCIRHFPVAVYAFFANNCRFDSRWLSSVYIDVVIGCFPGKFAKIER